MSAATTTRIDLLLLGLLLDRSVHGYELFRPIQMDRSFLLAQIDVVSRRFGREKAHKSYERTLAQLAPELQEAARRHGLDKLPQ